MSLISVLCFAPTYAHSPDRASSYPNSADSASTTTTITTTLSSYDWALLAESRPRRLPNPFHKPYSLIFNRNSSASAPYAASPRIPILKIHIATPTTKNHLDRISTILRTKISPDASPEEWLDTALAEMQKAEIVQRFSVKKFDQFVLDTLQQMPAPAARRASSGTTEMDYLALLSSNAEVKKMMSPLSADEEEEKQQERDRDRTRTLCGFRISSSARPEKLTYRTAAAPWERQDDPYGGLM